MARKLTSQPDASVLYLYGITRDTPSAVPHMPGVHQIAKVEPISCAGFTCWVSRVPASEYAENLATNMENLDWLSEKSVAHQRAISMIAEFTEILPARLGTVFLSESSLEADVKKRKKQISADFARVGGSDEWGVKVFVLAPKPGSQLTKGLTGKTYLQAKSQALRSKSAAKPDREVEQFDTELRKIAADTAAAGKISGARRDLLYQVSLLIRREQRKRFESLLRKYSSQWKDQKSIECTGPWPPYSFVSRRAG